jgi:hypothetical protein
MADTKNTESNTLVYKEPFELKPPIDIVKRYGLCTECRGTKQDEFGGTCKFCNGTGKLIEI